MAEETPEVKDSSRKSKKRGKDRSEDELTRLFSGDGVSYRAKIIGSDPVPGPSGHKICQDAMMKLKAVASTSRSRGQHKQRVLFSISFKGIRISDEKSGTTEYEHPIGLISYIARDVSDPRAFGYVCGASGAHCFYAVKTVQQAEPVVMDIHDVFQLLGSRKGQQPQVAGGDATLHLDEQKNFVQLALFGEISTSVEPNSPMTPAEEGWSNPTWGSPCNIPVLIRDPARLQNEYPPGGPGSVAHAGGSTAGNVTIFLDGTCGGETDTDDPDPASVQALDNMDIYASISKPSQPQVQQGGDPFALPPLSFDDNFAASMGHALPAALAGPPGGPESGRVPLSITIPAPRGAGLSVSATVSSPASLAGTPQAVPPSGVLGLQQQQQRQQQRQQKQQTAPWMPQMTQAAAVLASMASQATAQQNSASSQAARADVYREAFAGLEQPAAPVSQAAWPSPGQAPQPAWPSPAQTGQQAWPSPGQAPQPAWPSPAQTGQQAWPSPGQAAQQAWPSPAQTGQQAWPSPHQAFQPEWPQNQAFQPVWPSQEQAFQQPSWPAPHVGPGSGGGTQPFGVGATPELELELALGGEPVVSVFPVAAPQPQAAPHAGPARPPASAGPDPFSGLMGGVQATTK
ncbi:uncharacterized protein LOC116948875 [Petromyzon marinus]|nr:disabled homolog 1-like isoform X2 [Petromyzon marinus]